MTSKSRSKKTPPTKVPSTIAVPKNTLFPPEELELLLYAVAKIAHISDYNAACIAEIAKLLLVSEDAIADQYAEAGISAPPSPTSNSDIVVIPSIQTTFGRLRQADTVDVLRRTNQLHPEAVLRSGNAEADAIVYASACSKLISKYLGLVAVSRLSRHEDEFATTRHFQRALDWQFVRDDDDNRTVECHVSVERIHDEGWHSLPDYIYTLEPGEIEACLVRVVTHLFLFFQQCMTNAGVFMDTLKLDHVLVRKRRATETFVYTEGSESPISIESDMDVVVTLDAFELAWLYNPVAVANGVDYATPMEWYINRLSQAGTLLSLPQALYYGINTPKTRPVFENVYHGNGVPWMQTLLHELCVAIMATTMDDESPILDETTLATCKTCVSILETAMPTRNPLVRPDPTRIHNTRKLFLEQWNTYFTPLNDRLLRYVFVAEMFTTKSSLLHKHIHRDTDTETHAVMNTISIGPVYTKRIEGCSDTDHCRECSKPTTNTNTRGKYTSVLCCPKCEARYWTKMVKAAV